MTKLKTRKSILKRLKMTKTGKLLRRPTGQDHYNVKASGKKKRLKRRWIAISKADAKQIKRALLY